MLSMKEADQSVIIQIVHVLQLQLVQIDPTHRRQDQHVQKQLLLRQELQLTHLQQEVTAVHLQAAAEVVVAAAQGQQGQVEDKL